MFRGMGQKIFALRTDRDVDNDLVYDAGYKEEVIGSSENFPFAHIAKAMLKIG